eukprot:Gb_35114 [translate_table: standard]
MGELNRLPPGFRFHPTDEELVCYYLKGKSSKSKSKFLHFNAITDIDLYKHEPSDLPDKSCFQTGDRHWFFFTQGDKKYPNGSRKNRATENGYWKTTGKDRPVLSKGVIVGMRKLLVFYRGRAPRGERTNWLMHEYRLVDDGTAKSSSSEKDSFVLCRVFIKSRPGVITGEHYGASSSDAADNQCATLSEKEQTEEVVLSTAEEVQDRNSLLGSFTTLEQNFVPADDDLYRLLLECLNEPDNEQTVGDLLQIPPGVTKQSDIINGSHADLEDDSTLDDESSALDRQTVDQKLHSGENVHGKNPVYEANSSEHVLDFDGLLSPTVLAGDFIELNDLVIPLKWDSCS